MTAVILNDVPELCKEEVILRLRTKSFIVDGIIIKYKKGLRKGLSFLVQKVFKGKVEVGTILQNISFDHLQQPVM
ncbi:hypothetical protein COS54_00100 [Candidatus Shapirobacteria bacterium CG03_land_8_20_14_0_80_39_12]|uniref:Uncharacterized protein n=1 Tax=Candidatus Shapirobacteria bacterium CG03_land_8_20_14_0_80_39_12 TaxID=1974879 RepID=A0A2M7BG08_9BACT|nr:MAG: hypothetical protein COS54_00100 [Candidatus Shapirobacteria bacterium CG03_land_8_20_14_0_80_39_12]